MTNDMRGALRSIRRDAWTSSIIVLTLGVAMGASTIGFSFADFAILRGLPVDDSSRVVSIYGVDARQGNGRARLAPANFRDIKDRATTLTHIAAGQQTHATLIERGVPSRGAVRRSRPADDPIVPVVSRAPSAEARRTRARIHRRYRAC